jgi:hypothetical protein
MDDVVVRLTEHHVLLSDFARRIRGTSDRLSRNTLFDELAKALGGHFVALEFAVFPALSESASFDLGSEVLIRHMGLKRRLADLLMMERPNERFESELLRFCSEVEVQADLEQLELLPALRASLDDAERDFLATEVEVQMEARLGGRLHATEFSEPRKSMDILEEAKVVLGSLSGDRPARL